MGAKLFHVLKKKSHRPFRPQNFFYVKKQRPARVIKDLGVKYIIPNQNLNRPRNYKRRKMSNPKNRELTYTEQYFLSKYKKSNLIAAIKLAVKLIIIQAQSPNICDIVKFSKITITRTSEITYHGLLCTNARGFIMYLKDQLSEFDEKFRELYT
jgi:hypothetical protein